MRLVNAERGPRSRHFWIGPAGVHLYWPDVWKSRPDWCSKWKERP